MHFDNSISLGNVLTLVGMLVAFYSFHIRNVERFAKIEIKVDTMWRALKLNFRIDDE